MRLLMIILVLSLAVSLTGCFEEFEDGYQVGDLTRFTLREAHALLKARDEYCSDTSSSLLKEAALTAIRTQFPLYPEEGICTTLYPNVKRTGDSPAL